jgi:hypothetical protein
MTLDWGSLEGLRRKLFPNNQSVEVETVYEGLKWQEGRCNEANVVKYYDGNIIGVAIIADDASRVDVIENHNSDLMRALLELEKILSKIP